VIAPATAGAYGFTVRVPDSWFEFDIWRATRTGDLGRLVDARIAAVPQLRPSRGALIKLMREAAENAERRGARFCAVSGDLTEDGDMLAAAVLIFQTPGADDPALNRPEAIAAQVTAAAPDGGSATWRQVGVVETAAGTAVRTAGVERADLGGGRTADCVVMQTLLPVPGGNGVLNVVLTSPQVDLAEPMLDLFDAISATLAWAGPADGVA
jgi:hypothetical protein